MSLGGFRAADAGHAVEIELAVAQLAVAGQALAEGVQAVGLGLQLADAGGHGIDVALRVFTGGGHLGLLLVQVLLEPGDFGHGRAVGAAGRETGSERNRQDGEHNTGGTGRHFRIAEREFLR